MIDAEDGRPDGMPEDGPEAPKPWEYAPPEPVKTFEQRHEALIRRMNGRRTIMLIVCALTLIYIVMRLIDPSAQSVLSMSMPGILAELGVFLAELTGSRLIAAVPVVAAALLLLTCVLMWYLSRRHTAPIAVFLAIFAADTVLLGIAYPLFDSNSFVVSAVFHAWVLWSLIRLLADRMKLNRLWRKEEGVRSAWVAAPLAPRAKNLRDGRFR